MLLAPPLYAGFSGSFAPVLPALTNAPFAAAATGSKHLATLPGRRRVVPAVARWSVIAFSGYI